MVGVLWASAAAMAEPNPAKVIVFPLQGSPKSKAIEWVGEGIAESLSAQIRGPHMDVMTGNQVTELMEDWGFYRGARLSRGSLISIGQRAFADLIIIGSFEGTEKNIGITVRVFYMEGLKLSGNIAANGPLSVLPQIENELAWQILSDIGMDRPTTREKFYERTRKIPNSAYKHYIQSLGASSDSDRLRLLLKAVSICRDFPEAQFQLGSYYYRKGDCKDALYHLTMARNGDNTPMETEFLMGTCYLKTDQPRLAVDFYSRILRNSRPSEVLNNLGVAYLRGNENALALKAFGEANILAPTNSMILLNLSIAHQIQGNLSTALSMTEGAIEAYPNNGMLKFLMGFLLKGRGEDKNAATAFQEAADQGIDVKKLLARDPTTWLQVFSNWSSSKNRSAVGSRQSGLSKKPTE